MFVQIYGPENIAGADPKFLSNPYFHRPFLLCALYT